MLRSVKVAVTPEVETVLVPDSVAPDVPVPEVMATVTDADGADETVFP